MKRLIIVLLLISNWALGQETKIDATKRITNIPQAFATQSATDPSSGAFTSVQSPRFCIGAETGAQCITTWPKADFSSVLGLDSVVPGLISFGDSITCGYNSSNPTSLGYAYLLARDFSGISNNYCHSGDQAADMTRMYVYPNTNPTDGRNRAVTLMIGTNDVAQYGADTDKQAVFSTSLYSALAWLATPRSGKIFGQDTAVTTTGTWIADDTLQTGVAKQSNTQGSTATFTLTTTGGPIYVAYRIIDGNGGVATVSVDGNVVGTLNAFGNNGSLIHTNNNSNDSVALFRYPITAGNHTVVLTVTSATNASNVFSLVWAGTPTKISIIGFPRVYVGGVLRYQNDANSALTLTYDTIVRTVVNTLAGDGLNVTYVPTRDYVNATSDMDNAQHPNNIGHSHLRDAFAYIAKPVGMILANAPNNPIFSSPLTINAPAPPSSGNPFASYTNVNGSTLYNSSSLNPGLLVYSTTDGKYSFGLDLGNYSGKATTRLFAADTGLITLCFSPTASVATSHASFVCPFRLDPSGNLTIMGAFTSGSSSSPLSLNLPLAADLSKYSNFNAGNLASTTQLNPGTTLYTSGNTSFGNQLSYINSAWMNNLYAPNNGATIGHCFYTPSALPTGHSAFTCPFSTNGSTQVTTAVKLNATTSVTSPQYCIGSSCLTAWPVIMDSTNFMRMQPTDPSQSTNLWTYIGAMQSLTPPASSGVVAATSTFGTAVKALIDSGNPVAGGSFQTAQYPIVSSKAWTYETKVSMIQALEGIRTWNGVTNNSNIGGSGAPYAGDESVGFKYNNGGTGVSSNWICQTVTGGVAHNQDSGVGPGVGTAQTLTIKSDGTAATFYINGTAVCSGVTDHYPATGTYMMPMVYFSGNGASGYAVGNGIKWQYMFATW